MGDQADQTTTDDDAATCQVMIGLTAGLTWQGSTMLLTRSAQHGELQPLEGQQESQSMPASTTHLPGVIPAHACHNIPWQIFLLEPPEKHSIARAWVCVLGEVGGGGGSEESTFSHLMELLAILFPQSLMNLHNPGGTHHVRKVFHRASQHGCMSSGKDMFGQLSLHTGS